jgi:glycerol-3-phosphate dehydrogenase
VDVICRDLQRPVRPCGTANTPLPHAAIADVEGRLTEALRAAGTTLEPDVFAHLASWYGTEAPAVVAFSADRGLLDRLAPGTPVLAGEIAYAAAHGSAVHLDDVVLRRTALGSAGHPGRPAVERAAAIMSTAAGWHADDFWREIAGVDALYPPGAAERAGGAPGPRG